MAAQTQRRTPESSAPTQAPPATTQAPAASAGRGAAPTRGNGFAQDRLATPDAPAAPGTEDPARAAKAAYAERLWQVGTEIGELEDPVEQQRAARAVLGQAVEVQDQLEFGHTVELALLPRIPEGNQGSMPFRPLPPEWIRPARILLSLAGGTGAAAGGVTGPATNMWDATTSRSADSTSVFDKLSRTGREGADYGIYAYQTQSNNLASPEATCNATSMAMVLERLGYTRDDLVRGIELELKKRQEAARLRKEGVAEGELAKRLAAVDYTCVMLANDAWKTRVLQYLRAENGERRSQGYQKLRGAEQTDKQLQSWAGQFQENAGMDDLVHFTLDLLGLERTAINAGANPGKVVGFVNAATPGRTAPGTERIDAGGANTWPVTKARVQRCLEDGGAAMISIRHKGRGQEGTHICAIQTVESDGLTVDDPFGRIRADYHAGQSGDAYSSAKGGARDRDRKNIMDRAHPDDWKMTAPVTEEEVKGQSSHWADRTVASAWQYVMLFRRGGAAPAATTPAPAAATAAAPAAVAAH